MKFGLMYNTGIYGTDPDQMIAVFSFTRL